jgi:hypothetical protein
VEGAEVRDKRTELIQAPLRSTWDRLTAQVILL